MAKFIFTAGRFIRADVRSMLIGAEFDYPGLTWKEDKGFWDSTFYVSGPVKPVQAIANLMQKLVD